MTDESFDLATKRGRGKLKPRSGNAPYFARLSSRCYLGYRPSTADEGSGTWCARYRDDDGKHHTRSLGTQASYDDAAAAAKGFLTAATRGVIQDGALTVKTACENYLATLRAANRDKTAHDAEGRFKRLVYSDVKLSETKLSKLRVDQVREWFGRISRRPDDIAEEEFDEVAAKQGANRNLNTLKAAFNHALKDRLISDDHAWKTVVPHTGVHRQRVGAYLTKPERKRLILGMHTNGDIQFFAMFLALTGMRPGAAAELKVRQWDKKEGTLVIERDKAGEGRKVVVSTKVSIHLNNATKRLNETDYIFARLSWGENKEVIRRKWNKDAWKKPFKVAAVAAGLPDVTLYSLRHSAITDLITDGMPMATVATLTGTSVAMIERHYGHLQKDRSREALDKLGF